MTYPLNVLLEKIWEDGRFTGSRTNVKMVELCSIAERALSFLHTGNTAVLLTRLMNPLWTSQGLLVDGWPCFNENLVHFSNVTATEWRVRQWPFDNATRQPISAAYAGQGFHFGTEHAKVRTHESCL